MLRRALYASLLACVMATPAFAEVTLSEAVGRGLFTNPEYGAIANDRRATEKELDQAHGLFLPSVDLNGDTGFEYTDDPNTNAGTDGDDTEELFRYQAGVTLTQLLFDGFESQTEVERQRARVRSSSFRTKETAEFVGLDIVESYLEVIRQRELLDIARQNVAFHLNIMDQIQDAENAGKATQADIAQVKARVARARATEASVRQSLRNAESEYKVETGEMPGDLVFPSTPTSILEGEVDQAVKTSVTTGPTLRIFESDIDVATAESDQTNSVFYPQVDLQLNAQASEDVGGVEGDDKSASALVVANWNLYRGGIDTARHKEFLYRAAIAKEEYAEAARSVEDDVRQTWAAMTSERQRALDFNDQALANSQVVAAYKDQFDLGRRTLLDVLDAQNELFVSRSSTISSEFLEILAIYRLVALKGELLNTLNVDTPREASLDDIR